jgi:lysophospholipase L1-like esterase
MNRFAEMKTSTLGPRSFLAVVCLMLLAVSVGAAAGRTGTDQAGRLARFERIASTIRGESPALPSDALPLPIIKTDRQDRPWAAWPTWEAGRSQIELARFEGDRVAWRRQVGLPAGDAVSPDFAFSPDGDPWLIWVETSALGTRVLVLDVASERSACLASEPSASVTSPKIVFDGGGSPWAFWNITSGQSGEIVWRTMKGGVWVAPALVPGRSKWPALNPDAAVDPFGTVWLSWSGYDGRDYGIYLTRWTGTGWAPETRVSESEGPNLFPSLGLDPDGQPLVSWTRPSPGGRVVCVNSFRHGTVGRELVLEAPAGPPSPPRIIQDAGSPVLCLKSGEGITVQSLPQPSAGVYPGALAAQPAPRLLGSLQLDENKYAGIGDSITFGYVDYYPYPERGYIPRLDAILNASFGAQRVINEGVGGEVTADGLVRIDKVFIADLARYILIMEGTNDVIFNEISMDSSAFNLSEMVRKCLAAGAFPVIATILPRYDWYGSQSFYRDRLLSLNAKIRQVAVDRAVPLVDMYSAFANYPPASGGVLSLLSMDLKHPSDKGYQFMAETWFSGIRNFPFPPVNLKIEKLGPEKVSGGRTKAVSARSIFRAVPADARQPNGNLLTWAPSPKMYNPANILGYRIYRQRPAGSTAPYELLAFFKEPLEYFDRGVAVLNQSRYVISTVRWDGIEGPISDPVR